MTGRPRVLLFHTDAIESLNIPKLQLTQKNPILACSYTRRVRRVIRQQNDNFIYFLDFLKKSLKNASMKRFFHFSEKWEFRMAEFAALQAGQGCVKQFVFMGRYLYTLGHYICQYSRKNFQQISWGNSANLCSSEIAVFHYYVSLPNSPRRSLGNFFLYIGICSVLGYISNVP